MTKLTVIFHNFTNTPKREQTWQQVKEDRITNDKLNCQVCSRCCQVHFDKTLKRSNILKIRISSNSLVPEVQDTATFVLPMSQNNQSKKAIAHLVQRSTTYMSKSYVHTKTRSTNYSHLVHCQALYVNTKGFVTLQLSKHINTQLEHKLTYKRTLSWPFVTRLPSFLSNYQNNVNSSNLYPRNKAYQARIWGNVLFIIQESEHLFDNFYSYSLKVHETDCFIPHIEDSLVVSMLAWYNNLPLYTDLCQKYF